MSGYFNITIPIDGVVEYTMSKRYEATYEHPAEGGDVELLALVADEFDISEEQESSILDMYCEEITDLILSEVG
jgi:hypothetical protein